MVQNRFPETCSLWSVRIVSYSRFLKNTNFVVANSSSCFHFCENPEFWDGEWVQNRSRRGVCIRQVAREVVISTSACLHFWKSWFGGFLEPQALSSTWLEWFSGSRFWRCKSHLYRTNLFYFGLLPVHMLIWLYTNFDGNSMRHFGQNVL